MSQQELQKALVNSTSTIHIFHYWFSFKKSAILIGLNTLIMLHENVSTAVLLIPLAKNAEHSSSNSINEMREQLSLYGIYIYASKAFKG